MDLGDQYLRFIWNTFDTNLALSSRELFNERSFTDVTLVSDDLQVTTAHRLVLSRSSSTFQKLLLINSSANSTLYLRGIRQNVLDLILHFIYTGEVDVPTDEITDFLKAANDLNISELKNRPQSSYNEAQSTDTESLESFQDSTESDADSKRMDYFQEEKWKSSIPSSNNIIIRQEAERTMAMEEKVQKQKKTLPSFITGVEDCPALDVRNEKISNKVTKNVCHEEIQYKSQQVSKTLQNIANINSLPKFKMDKAIVCASCSQSFKDQLSYLRHMRFGHKYK